MTVHDTAASLMATAVASPIAPPVTYSGSGGITFDADSPTPLTFDTTYASGIVADDLVIMHSAVKGYPFDLYPTTMGDWKFSSAGRRGASSSYDYQLDEDGGMPRNFNYFNIASSSLSGNLNITSPEKGGGYDAYYNLAGACTLRFTKPAWGQWEVMGWGTQQGEISTSSSTLDGVSYNFRAFQNTGMTSWRTGQSFRAVDSDSDGMFIAVGDSGLFWRSRDNGANWASSTPPWSTTMYAIQWTKGVWVVAGASGILYSSPDGYNWTSRTSGFGTSLIYGMGVNDGTFMICGATGKIARSTNGTDWSLITHSLGTNALYDITYGERSERWITVGTVFKWGYSTNDGLTWTIGPNSGAAGTGNDLTSVMETVDQATYSPYAETTYWQFGGLVNAQYAPYGLFAYGPDSNIETTGVTYQNSSPTYWGSMWGSVYSGTIGAVAASGYLNFTEYAHVLYRELVNRSSPLGTSPPDPQQASPGDYRGVAVNKKDASYIVAVGSDRISRGPNHILPRSNPISGVDIQDGDIILVFVSLPSNTFTHTNPRIRDHHNHLDYTDIEWLGVSASTTLGNNMNMLVGISFAREKAGVKRATGQLTYYASSNATDANPYYYRKKSAVSYIRLRIYGPSGDMRATASLTAEGTVKKVGLVLPSPGSLYTASLVADAFIQRNSTPSYINNSSNSLGTGETSGTTMTNPNSGWYGDAGTLTVVCVTSDNTSATTPTFSISDAGGNTYTQIAFQGQNASGGKGVVGAMFYTLATANTGAITATLSESTSAKCMIVRTYQGLDGSLRSSGVTSSGASATPTVTSGTVNAGDLVVAMAGVENEPMATADTDTLYGTWAVYHYTSSGSSGARSQSIGVAHKIPSSSGAQTFNPASSPSTDWVEIIAVFAATSGVDLGFYWRANAALTASIDIIASHDAEVSLEAVASDMYVDAEWIEGDTPQASLIASVQDATDDMATAVLTAVGTVNLNAASDMAVEAYVPQTIEATVADMTATATDLVVNAGYGYDTTVSDMVATATNPTIGSLNAIVIPPEGTSNYDNTPIDKPDGYPDFAGMDVYKFTSVYGPTGSAGSIVELTDRRYQELVRSSTLWSHPNGPNGNYFNTYTMGARNSAVTPLGGDKFLVTWLQENWHQYYQDWSGYDPIYRELSDLPLRLVATVVDCSNNADVPIIGETVAYDMPIGLRFFRTGAPQDAKADPDGNVCGIFSGFSIMPMSWTPDHGTWSSVYVDPINIAFKVSMNGSTPTFSWVKTIGVVNSVSGFYNQIMYDGSNPVYCLAGYTGSVLLKLSGSTGSSLGYSSGFGASSGWEGGIACMYSGSDGMIIGNISGDMVNIHVDLDSLAIGSFDTFTPAIHLYGHIWKAKKDADGNWYTMLADDESPYLQVYKWRVNGSNLELVSKHISDIPHIKTPTLPTSSMLYQNYVRSYDMLEFWVAYGTYAPAALVSIYSKNGFCPGAQYPSLAMIASQIGEDQSPEHAVGPQVIGQMPPSTDAETPVKPRGWVSSPRELDSWQHYFPSGYLDFGEIDIAEISNGKIVVVVADTYGAADADNGVFRIFSYIADPQNDPPPLKMSQRDDDKRAGGKRLGYNPGQESTIRSGWVAW